MNESFQKVTVKSTFGRDLAEINSLDGFSEWFFYNGMMFGRYEKWWGDGGERQDPHEGLDIYYYVANDRSIRRLDGDIKVPVMFDGVVFDISDDDYLGKSIFVRHDMADSNGFFLHSVYAHSTPVNGLHVGQNVEKGEVVAHIADIRERNLKIPGHLHVSMIYMPEDYPKDMLKWSILAVTYNARLVDPIGYLECAYSTGDYTP
jgi:murein DD-endopeptidase MepM/ murein hydrolase activator NlpD